MQVLTREEMQRLLIQAKEDGCYELLLLELSAGLRRGELLALQWDDLDLGPVSCASADRFPGCGGSWQCPSPRRTPPPAPSFSRPL